MNNFKPFIMGICQAILIWLIIIIADAIDEYIFDKDFFLGFILFFLIPICMIVIYIIIIIRKKPLVKDIILWFTGYYFMFLPIWYFVADSVNNKTFIVTQHSRTDFLDFNGIELIFYGYGTLLFFTLICILFHVIKYISNKFNNK